MNSLTSLKRTGADLLAPVRPLVNRGERMLPDFLVVGSKRAGTTSVYHYIIGHPAVAPCLTSKGTHFFDVNFHRGTSWFRSGFPRPSAQWQVTGEASPYYMFHPLAPERIAAVLPDVKLIVVLRDPVARTWSHYHCEVRNGVEPLAFEEALEREEERLAGEAERMRREPGYESFALRHYSYLARGRYAEQLETLLRLFPAEQVLVLQSERLLADPHAELAKAWDFLGLPPVHLERLQPMHAGTYGPLAEDTVTRLREYFAPHNERLYALPGIDFRWEEGR